MSSLGHVTAINFCGIAQLQYLGMLLSENTDFNVNTNGLNVN